MNTLVENLSSLITGTKSDNYSKELKPYLIAFVVNVFGLLALQIAKSIFHVF